MSGIIFSTVGILTIILALYAGYSQNEFNNNAKSTSAHVNNVEAKENKTTYTEKRKGKKTKNKRTVTTTKYTAHVTYEVDGKVYSGIELENVSSWLKAGDTITIYYDENDPTRIDDRLPNSTRTMIIIAVAGVIFLIFGVYNLRSR